MGNGEIPPSHRIKTHQLIDIKFWIYDYIREVCAHINFCKNQFSSSPASHTRWHNDRGITQGCAFWGVRTLKLISNFYIIAKKRQTFGHGTTITCLQQRCSSGEFVVGTDKYYVVDAVLACILHTFDIQTTRSRLGNIVLVLHGKIIVDAFPQP